jgi:hypothetical protein
MPARNMRERASLEAIGSFGPSPHTSGPLVAGSCQTMGHSTTTLTGDRYSHALLEDFLAAAVRLDRTYEAALASYAATVHGPTTG